MSSPGAADILAAPRPDSVAAHSDRSLLRQYREGNPDAAAQLYHRYAERLRILAQAQLSAGLARRVDPDDILQSVFSAFFHGARRGDYEVPDGEDLWGLLLVIALNKVRAQAVFHHAARRDSRLTRDVDFGERPAVASPEKDPNCVTFFRLVVQEAFEKLPPPHRAAMELRLEGHEVGEIARRTGRSKRTVERILQEARDHLKSTLGRDE